VRRRVPVRGVVVPPLVVGRVAVGRLVSPAPRGGRVSRRRRARRRAAVVVPVGARRSTAPSLRVLRGPRRVLRPPRRGVVVARVLHGFSGPLYQVESVPPSFPPSLKSAVL